MAQLTFVGGGSYNWMPQLLARLLKGGEFCEDSIVLMDTDPAALREVATLAETMQRAWKSPVSIRATTDLDAALEGADYVTVAIAVGGLEAMRHDVAIPEGYGIYQTVGDTVGPGGLVRALRNVPVFVEMARRMERLCPHAWMLNLSNPLSTITRAVTRETRIRAAGLCQGVVEHVDFLTRLLGGDPARTRFVTAGIDHCPWLLELAVDGRDGIAALRERGLCRTDLKPEDLPQGRDGHLELATGMRAGFALWHELGALPGIADRHLTEFFPHILTSPEQIERFGVRRTSVDDRARMRAARRTRVLEMTAGRAELPAGDTHAPVAEAVLGLEGRRDGRTTLNVENVGQIPELPPRANVETLCRIDALGVHPVTIGRALPKPVEAIVRPHVLRQEGTIDAALNADFEGAVRLLATDPLVRRVGDARAMLTQMVDATRAWLPQF